MYDKHSWLCPKNEKNGTEKMLTQKCTNPAVWGVHELFFWLDIPYEIPDPLFTSARI